MTGVSNHSNSLPLYSSRPGRPPKRASVGLSLAASHLAAATGHHPQHSLKKHRMDNGDYYENGHLGKCFFYPFLDETLVSVNWLDRSYDRFQLRACERLFDHLRYAIPSLAPRRSCFISCVLCSNKSASFYGVAMEPTTMLHRLVWSFEWQFARYSNRPSR